MAVSLLHNFPFLWKFYFILFLIFIKFALSFLLQFVIVHVVSSFILQYLETNFGSVQEKLASLEFSQKTMMQDFLSARDEIGKQKPKVLQHFILVKARNIYEYSNLNHFTQVYAVFCNFISTYKHTTSCKS